MGPTSNRGMKIPRMANMRDIFLSGFESGIFVYPDQPKYSKQTYAMTNITHATIHPIMAAEYAEVPEVPPSHGCPLARHPAPPVVYILQGAVRPWPSAK